MNPVAVPHFVDSAVTEAGARVELGDIRISVAWYTNRKHLQSVVHSHPYHELVLVIGGGDVRYSIDGSVYILHPGDLIYFPAQVYHSGTYNITENLSERYVIQIDDALWQAARRNTSIVSAEWVNQVTVLDQDACRTWNLKSLFERMAQAAQAANPTRDMLFESEVSELLLLITMLTGRGQTTAPSSTSLLVARATEYLQNHYRDPALNATVLAQELYASRGHLSRAFKECTLESIHGYLTNLRMQHCCRCLANGVPVLTACAESGFPDYSSFLKTFRRMYGITPAEFRAQHLKKAEKRRGGTNQDALELPTA